MPRKNRVVSQSDGTSKDRVREGLGRLTPQEVQLRTTNPVESPFSALRLRTDAARRFKKVANARAVIWKMLLVAEKRFRRLKAPHLMKDVYQGAQYVNGVPVNPVTQEKAA